MLAHDVINGFQEFANGELIENTILSQIDKVIPCNEDPEYQASEGIILHMKDKSVFFIPIFQIGISEQELQSISGE